jgi:hypothetical protein
MRSLPAGLGKTQRPVDRGVGGNRRQSALPCGARRLPPTRPPEPHVEAAHSAAGDQGNHPDLAPEHQKFDQRRRPSANTITARFGTWNAALKAAGLTPRWNGTEWTQPSILEGLRRYAAGNGRAPRSADRIGPLSHYPSPALVISRFGTWSAALHAAGLQPGGSVPLTKDQIVSALRAYHHQHHRSPTTTAWKATRLKPTVKTISHHCGSWANALALANLPPTAA